MPRRARAKSSTGIYHVILRGINRQSIFLDNEDNEKFLQVIEECKAICDFNLYGYCLMGNHVHILLKEGKERLEQVFKRIGTRYVYWYNRKYIRSGHLFQDRYKSEVIESDPYFAVALRYIHQNPRRAGLCKSLREHKWSSYKNYFGKSGIVDTRFALEVIGKSNFENFMNEEKDDNCMEDNEARKRLSDEDLIIAIEEKFKIKAVMIQNKPKDVMKQMLRGALEIDGTSTRQLSRVTGVSTNIIWTL